MVQLHIFRNRKKKKPLSVDHSTRRQLFQLKKHSLLSTICTGLNRLSDRRSSFNSGAYQQYTKMMLRPCNNNQMAANGVVLDEVLLKNF